MMDSIRNTGIKIKRVANNREFLITLLIVLMSFASFGLGRLSLLEGEKEGVFIEHPSISSQSDASVYKSAPAATENKKFVASKNGTKYHQPWCPGAQKISEANKIWFASQEEAEKAGYTPAANCKGL